jgi:hypothetical protein
LAFGVLGLGGYGNLPLFFSSSLFFFAHDHFSLLNSVSVMGYRDMMHIKQASKGKLAGLAGRVGQGENGSGCFCFLFWIRLDSSLLFLFIWQQQQSRRAALHIN